MSVESELAQNVLNKVTGGSRWKKYIPLLLIFLIGLSVGAWIMHSWYISDLRDALTSTRAQLSDTEKLLYTEKQKPPVIKTETKAITELSYVPKEIIIYKDAITGTEAAVQEKTDIDMKVKAPTVYMRYNGKDFEMQGISGEANKFEKGKLIGEISTAATIDVTDLVNKELVLQREGDKTVLTAKLNEIAARKYRPQIDLVGGNGMLGGGIRINRVGADYLRTSETERILLRYTILK